MNFNKGAGSNTLTFPIDQSQIDNLSPCDLVNPYSMDDAEVLIDTPLIDIPEVGTPEFEAELVECARMVRMAKDHVPFDHINHYEFDWFGLSGQFLPEVFAGDTEINEMYDVDYNVSTAYDLGVLVHNDYPTQVMDDLMRMLRAQGAKIDTSLFPSFPYKVFTKGVVALEAVIALMIRRVSPTAFAHKYHFGRPRPEEVVHAWLNGEISFSQVTEDALEFYVDQHVVKADARRFTLYPEGCPNHPSLPAMHSAVAAMGLVMGVILDLTPTQLEECKKATIAVAFGRTFAGVHYRLDNLYGLELGERCAEIILPQMMSELMGASAVAVADKIVQIRTNWLS
jgi:hypothetical protein